METGSNRIEKGFNRRLRDGLIAVWTFATIAAVSIACSSVSETSTLASPSPPPVEQLPVPSPTTQQTIKKKSPARLPRVEAALKKAVHARLNSWKASIETRSLDKHLQHYADQVGTYYLASNVNQDFIRADRERAFNQFDQFKLQLINVEVNLEANDAATITFDKSWDFTRGENFSNGLVQQEIQMRKIEKQWFITSEKDLEIYRYRNN